MTGVDGKPYRDAKTGRCAHPLLQAASPDGVCYKCGVQLQPAARKRKAVAEAFLIGRDAAGVHPLSARPEPTHAAPYARAGHARPVRWKAPADAPHLEDKPQPDVLDADGIKALLRKVDAETMKRDFSAFVRMAWHVVNPGEAVVWGWHLDAICRHVQWAFEELFRVRAARRDKVPREDIVRQAVQNLMVNVPPRSAKSLIVGVFAPVWAWLHDPTLTIRCTSGNLRVSDLCSDQSYDLITSEWFRETFAPSWTVRGDRTAKRRWENTEGGVRISQPMGAIVTGEGTDVIIVDDPHDARDVASEKKRNAVISKWDRSLRNRVQDPDFNLRICIMQRLHETDFAGHVLAKGGWVHLCIPMEFEPDRRCITEMRDEQTGKPWVDPRAQAGDLMLPAYFTRAFVEHEKTELGSYGYAGQMQQRPAPEDGGLFQKSWFGDFDAFWLENGDPDWSRMPKIDQLYLSIDATFTESDTSDFVSIQVIGRAGRFRYVLDNVTRRMDFVKMMAALRDIIRKWSSGGKRITSILIEKAANGSAATSMLQSAGVGAVIEIKPEGGKFSRAAAVAPFCEAHDVLIPRGVPWRDGWLHELAVFPNGAHDDQVDAFTQALNHMRGSVDVARLLASCKW